MIKLSKNKGINRCAIKLIKDKQLLYCSIYAFSLVKQKTLKIYIKTYQKTRFIRRFKSLASVAIIFDKKPNVSLCLCVNNQGFKNFIIKNQYLLLLISKSLD